MIANIANHFLCFIANVFLSVAAYNLRVQIELEKRLLDWPGKCEWNEATLLFFTLFTDIFYRATAYICKGDFLEKLSQNGGLARDTPLSNDLVMKAIASAAVFKVPSTHIVGIKNIDRIKVQAHRLKNKYLATKGGKCRRKFYEKIAAQKFEINLELKTSVSASLQITNYTLKIFNLDFIFWAK